MEVERIYYTFGVARGKELEVLRVHQRLIKYFQTLKDLVEDGDQSLAQYGVIMISEDVNKRLFMWCIDAASIYDLFGADTMKDLYVGAMLQEDDSVERLFTLFKDSREPTLPEIPLLLNLCNTMDWLGAIKPLMAILLDKVYALLKPLSTESVELLLVNKNKKRKVYDDDGGIPYTPYFRRERLIYKVLNQYLPVGVVREKLPILQERINPVSPVALGLREGSFLYLTKKGAFTSHISKPNSFSTYRLPAGKPLLFVNGGAESETDAFNVCLTTSGLYTYGKSSTGALAIGPTVKNKVYPWTLVSNIESEVLLIACSLTHLVVLTTTGLYTCGSNKYGQLGLGDTVDRNVLTLVPGIIGDILDIQCSGVQTVILTTKGLYRAGFSFTYNNHAHQKLTAKDWGIFTPFVTEEKKIVSIIPLGFTVLLGTNEGLYTCQPGIREPVSGNAKPSIHNTCVKHTKEEDIASPLAVYARNLSIIIVKKVDGLYGIKEQYDSRNEVILGFTKLPTPWHGQVENVTILADSFCVVTLDGVYMSAIQYESTALYRKKRPTLFIKLDIDLGYIQAQSFLNFFGKDDDDYFYDTEDDREEPPYKKKGLRCEHCHGFASYYYQAPNNQKTPLCSESCLLQLLSLS